MDFIESQIQLIDQKIKETESLLSDPDLASLAKDELVELTKQKEDLQKVLENPNNYSEQTNQNNQGDSLDRRNAILEIKGAAGGDESKLFAGELLRMYQRFASLKGFHIEELDEFAIKIIGRGAFGIFKYEAGVHRVQRVPETEKKGRVHTSTSVVSVLPELEDIDLHINPDDIVF